MESGPVTAPKEWDGNLYPGRPMVVDGREFNYQYMGDELFLPACFPKTMIDMGLKLPAKWYECEIVVDGLVGGEDEDNPGDLEGLKSVKSLFKGQKGKKGNTVVPDYDDNPIELRVGESVRFARYIIMKRENRTPLLFIGFDFNANDLETYFWQKALDVRSKFQNPKAPKPRPMGVQN